MEFTKLTWKNEQAPALDADNLNRIEDAIQNLVDRTSRFCQISSTDCGENCTIINNGMYILDENNKEVSGTSSSGFCQVKVPDGIKYVKVTVYLYSSGTLKIDAHVNQQNTSGKDDIGKIIAWVTDYPNNSSRPASASASVIINCDQGKYIDVKLDQIYGYNTIINLIVEEVRSGSVY